MKSMKEIVKKVDISWVINLCHQPGAKLNYIIEQITSKYNDITATEARDLICLVAMSEAFINMVEEHLKKEESK